MTTLSEKEEKMAADAAKERVRSILQTEPAKGDSVQGRMEKIAKGKTEEQRAKDADKARKAELKKMPKEERAVEKAKDKLEKAKRKLEEAKKLKNDKKIEKAKKEVEKAKKDLEKARKNLRKRNLAQLAKDEQNARKGMKDADDSIKRNPKNKDKDKDKDKEKGKEKDAEVKKAEMQKKYQRITLPEGMEIHQEGPSWKLYNKQGQSKDVTSEMEALIKTNKAIDAANAQIDKNNKLNMGASVATAAKDQDMPTRDNAKTGEMTENTALGVTTGQMRVADPARGMTIEPASVPEVKVTDIDGKDLSPEVAKGLATVAVSYAFDDNDLERLKDKDKKHQNEGDEKKRQQQQVVKPSYER